MRLLTSTPCGIAFALLLAAISTPSNSLAQDEVKYGFVNITQVITQSEQGKAEAKKLEAFGTEKEKDLIKRQQELAALTKKFEEGVNSGQPDEELRNRIEKVQRELERDARQAQSDVDVSRQDRIQAIGKGVVEVVKKFAEDNGYTVIFRVDGGQIVYLEPKGDITEQIIEAYNKAHPAE